MNLVELDHALRKLRLSGMADVLETRLRQAQTETAGARSISSPRSSATNCCADRTACSRAGTSRRGFRDPDRSLDSFDFDFNKKMNRALIHELATGALHRSSAKTRSFSARPARARATSRRPSAAPPSSRATASSIARRTPLLEEIADATLDGTRKAYLADLATVPLLIIDDLGMRKLPHTAAEDLLELVMRRYERASTLLTSNRPVDDWGKLLGDTAAVTALLDRLLHHAHVLKCGPRSWRTKVQTDLRTEDPVRVEL